MTKIETKSNVSLLPLYKAAVKKSAPAPASKKKTPMDTVHECLRNGVYEIIVMASKHQPLPKGPARTKALAADYVAEDGMNEASYTRPEGRWVLGKVAEEAVQAMARSNMRFK